MVRHGDSSSLYRQMTLVRCDPRPMSDPDCCILSTMYLPSAERTRRSYDLLLSYGWLKQPYLVEVVDG